MLASPQCEARLLVLRPDRMWVAWTAVTDR